MRCSAIAVARLDSSLATVGEQSVPITDERTMAGWLAAPTESRAEARRERDEPVLIDRCEIEEHVTDPESGTTKRCDATLSSGARPIFSAELKRPEIAVIDQYSLKKDAHTKANARGLKYYATVNFREAALWRTDDGPGAAQPLVRMDLAPGLSDSSDAPRRRDDLRNGWKTFLDAAEEKMRQEEGRHAQSSSGLPPHVKSLADLIRQAGAEAAGRIAAAIAANTDFAARVRELFEDQFGVDVALDPQGPAGRFGKECELVARISAFVVATRLILYVALKRSGFSGLDALDVDPRVTDPWRIYRHLDGLYDHARHETQDFEIQLQPSEVDEVVFVRAAGGGAVGLLWNELAHAIEQSNWGRPAEYVPGLYEALLTDEHRHAMGVHYTPDTITELLCGYAIQRAADRVLEPSSGAGTFAVTSYLRKRELGSTHEQAMEEVYANELARFAAGLTMLNLSLAEGSARASYPRVAHSDFFDLYPGSPTGLELPPPDGRVILPESFDAVVGNPPYVRFESRTSHENAAVEQALARDEAHQRLTFPNFTGKADLYAYFIAHSTAFLREEGRLAFIVSWSLLSTVYGDRTLEFLGKYYHIEALIDSKIERFFAAETNTVMVLAKRLAKPPGEMRPSLPDGALTRLVRLKRPLEELWNPDAASGKRCEDLVAEVLLLNTDSTDDTRWDVKVVRQQDFVNAAQ